MARSEIILVVSMLAFIGSCEGDNEYDYLQVVIQWQPATCSDSSKPYPYCNQVPENRFSIHGVWPSLYSGQTKCSGSPFDVNQVRILQPGLSEIWPNVITGDNQWLWGHEWDKHGTCTETMILNQEDYFSFAMDTFNDYNLEYILKNSGIWPNEEVYYTKDQLYAAIRAKTGKLPALRCNYNRWTGYQQLHEISLCYNWEASAFVDCPPNANKCYDDYIMWYSYQ